MADYSKYYANVEEPKVISEQPISVYQKQKGDIYAKQREQDIQSAAYIYSQKMGVPVSDALDLIKAKDENIRNQAKFQVSQETRNLKAQNDVMNAGMALHQVDLTKEGATDQLAKIQSSIAQHSGTEAAKPVFEEINKALQTAKGFDLERIKLSAQERATKAEELKTSPIQAGLMKAAEVKAGIEAQSQEEENLRKIEEAKHPGRAAAQEKAEQLKQNMQNLQFFKAEEESVRDQLKQKGLKGSERKQLQQQLSGITSQISGLRSSLYAPQESEQVTPVVSPSGQIKATPTKTTSIPAPQATPTPAESFSAENPFAVQAQQEQQIVEAKTAKEKTQKEKESISVSRYKAAQAEKVAQENLKDPSKLVFQQGEFASEPTTQELAGAYELAKKQLNKARSTRLYYEARDPEWVSINLRNLSGDELESFKTDYLAPAIFEEAGGDPEKARAIAAERGYSFE
jgi:hypothetical protein